MAKKIALDLNVKSDTVATANKRTQTATRQLRELREQLASGELKGEAFEQAARRAAALQDQIDKVNKTVRTLANDNKRLDAFVDTAQGIAGGFAAAQGAAALFGSENEDLQKTFVKLQGAIALLNGVQAVSNVLRKESALNTVLLGSANVTATASTNALTVATTAFRKALIATGIGAAVVAVGLLVANFDKLRNLMRDTGKEIDDNIKGIDKKIERLDMEADILVEQLNNLKLQGKETKEMRQLIMDNLTERINETNEILTQLEAKQEIVQEEAKTLTFMQKARLVAAGWFGTQVLIGEVSKQLNDQKEKELEISDEIAVAQLRLERLEGRRLSAIREQNVELAKRRQAQEKEAEEERKRLEAQDKRHRDRALQLIEDQEEREMAMLREKHRREMEEAVLHGDNIKQLEEIQFNELLALEQKFIHEKEALQKAANDDERERTNALTTKLIEDAHKRAEQIRAAEEMMKQVRMENAMAILNLMKATDKETEAEQRKAFRRNQNLAIAETAITTFEAAQRAYNNQLTIPSPDAPIRANAAAADAIKQGLARVKMIAGQKFRGAGGASGMGMQGQSVDFATRPQLPIRGIETEDRRVFVLENDISRTQRRVRTIEAQSVID